MQTMDKTGLAEPSDPGLAERLGEGIARGAAIVATLTILSRVLGLVRTLVFSQTVGATCLGTAYVTANQVPNLLYELILGGALTSAMIPVLARSAERAPHDPAEKARVSDITSALLTWSVIIVVPLVLIIIVAAGPIASLLNPANANAHCVRADMVAVTGNMLRVFAPQALLYGLSVVLYRAAAVLPPVRRAVHRPGDLQPGAHRLLRGLRAPEQGTPAGPASPHSRACTIAGDHAGHRRPARSGHTAHVAPAPSVPACPSVPDGVARRAGGLALVGVVELIAIDLANVVAIALANGHGTTGAIVLFNYSSQVFNSISAILALSIVVSAFPVMSAREGSAFDRTSAGSTRAVLLMSWLGTAVMAAIAVPAAHVLANQPDQVPQLIEAFALFAPGVAGIAVIANLSRMMFVIGRLKVAAAALAGSWLLVIAADVVLVQLVPPRLVVAALALGTTIGQTVVAIPLVFVTRRICGKAALQGLGHAALPVWPPARQAPR